MGVGITDIEVVTIYLCEGLETMWDIVVAYYGAVLGTAGTVLGVKNYLRDRIRVKIDIQKGMKIVSPNPITNNPDELLVVVTANNVGRHPVHLSKAWFELRKPKEDEILLVGPNNFHTEELKPGLSRVFLAKQSDLDLTDLKYACVQDAVGRKFKRKVPKEWRC